MQVTWQALDLRFLMRFPATKDLRPPRALAILYGKTKLAGSYASIPRAAVT